MAIDALPESPVPAQPLPPTPPAQPPVPRTRAGGSSRGTLLLGLAAIVAVGGIAFAAGRLTAPDATSGRGAFPGGIPGYQGNGFVPGASVAPDASGRPDGGFGPGGMETTLAGTIAAISGDTLTLTTESGQTIEVSVAGAAWHGQTSASASDATVGAQVEVQVSGGFGRNPVGGQVPGANPDPSASAAPGAGNITASEVTILQE